MLCVCVCVCVSIVGASKRVCDTVNGFGGAALTLTNAKLTSNMAPGELEDDEGEEEGDDEEGGEEEADAEADAEEEEEEEGDGEADEDEEEEEEEEEEGEGEEGIEMKVMQALNLSSNEYHKVLKQYRRDLDRRRRVERYTSYGRGRQHYRTYEDDGEEEGDEEDDEQEEDDEEEEDEGDGEESTNQWFELTGNSTVGDVKVRYEQGVFDGFKMHSISNLLISKKSQFRRLI